MKSQLTVPHLTKSDSSLRISAFIALVALIGVP